MEAFNKKRIELAIEWILLIGISIAFLLVGIGFIIYLTYHGNTMVGYQQFIKPPSEFTSQKGIWHNFLNFTGEGLIQIGLLFLVGIQILRMALLTWFYAKSHDVLFFGMSLFILGVLLYSFCSL